jgi:hypothetical protein
MRGVLDVVFMGRFTLDKSCYQEQKVGKVDVVICNFLHYLA